MTVCLTVIIWFYLHTHCVFPSHLMEWLGPSENLTPAKRHGQHRASLRGLGAPSVV